MRETKGVQMDAVTDIRRTDGVEDDLGALLVRCGQGDRAAFAAMYDIVVHRAYGLSLRILRDRADAEDATHEAFIDLWRGASRFDPARESGCAWILAVVHRKAVDRCRPRGASSMHDPLVPSEALELAYFQGFTCSEVAAVLGIPVGTVKMRIRDGLLRLRAERPTLSDG